MIHDAISLHSHSHCIRGATNLARGRRPNVSVVVWVYCLFILESSYLVIETYRTRLVWEMKRRKTLNDLVKTVQKTFKKMRK